jgi:hypothetical protein
VAVETETSEVEIAPFARLFARAVELISQDHRSASMSCRLREALEAFVDGRLSGISTYREGDQGLQVERLGTLAVMIRDEFGLEGRLPSPEVEKYLLDWFFRAYDCSPELQRVGPQLALSLLDLCGKDTESVLTSLNHSQLFREVEDTLRRAGLHLGMTKFDQETTSRFLFFPRNR